MQRIERLVLFPGQLLAPPSGVPRVAGLERVPIETDEGKVEAWFLPAPSASGAARPAVVFAHGNGELIDEWAEPLEAYRRLGVSVLLPEYRGFGRSAGTPSEAAIASDFVRFYDELVKRSDVDAERIVFHGRSLGGGAVCALARTRAPAGLVLESTFTSVANVARGWGIPQFLVTNHFDSESVVRAFPHPILILHGRRDRVIPYAHAEALVRTAQRARLVSFDCDHNDMRRPSDGYWSEIEAYLRSVGVLV
jgi:fermentation-respiration switch protein FrsA (DUF1100 family)